MFFAEGYYVPISKFVLNVLNFRLRTILIWHPAKIFITKSAALKGRNISAQGKAGKALGKYKNEFLAL